MSLSTFLRRLPKAVLMALGLLLVVLLWFLDYATGPELSLFIFYVVPVVLVVWFVGRQAALALSVIAAAAWFLADFLEGRVYAHPAIPLWNVAEKLIFFVLVVQVISTLKAALEREKLVRQEFLERELVLAKQVQERLFPQRPPALATLECAGVCWPARGVGGDYFDFVPVAHGRVGLAVGDVSGKGLSAALLMASLQASLRSFASVNGGSARQVVSDTNRQLCSLTEINRFVTLFFGIYDDARRELTYLNAGHNSPMLFRARDRGARPERLRTGGTVVGLFPRAAWEQATLRLEPGDLIVVFTDGIPEAGNAEDEEFGEKRLQSAVLRHRHLAAPALSEALLREVAEFLGDTPAQDDLTVLVARVREAPPTSPATAP
jgi:serine phosphatase RsbU (regulator of sigma subunit)